MAKLPVTTARGSVLPGSLLKEVWKDGRCTLEVYGSAVPSVAELQDIHTQDIVSQVYDTIFATEERIRDEPLAHLFLKPKEVPPPKEKPLEWRRPGIRMERKVKRYKQFADI